MIARFLAPNTLRIPIPGLTLAGMLIMASHLRAGSVDNRNNNSADYIRTFSRNAATEGGDVSIYNPAGAIRLQDGLLVSLNNQTVSKFNEHILAKPSVGYKSEITSPFYPTGFLVYKKDRWAGFGAFSFPGGGGELEYEKGSATVFLIQTNLAQQNPPQNANAYLRSLYYGATVGGAYSINEKFSASLAARYIYARTDVEVDAGINLPPQNTSKAIDHMEEARGVGGILGIDFFPTPGTTLGLRLESATPLEWEVQRSSLNLESVIKDAPTRSRFTDSLRLALRAPGSKFQRDLPMNLGLGAAHHIIPSLRTDFSFNYYFNALADWDGKEDSHSDGWEAALSLEYLWPMALRTSIGGQYTVSGAGPENYQIENPALDSWSLGAGAKYDITPRISFAAAFAGNFTFSDGTSVSSLGTTADLEKRTFVTAFGIEYRAF